MNRYMFLWDVLVEFTTVKSYPDNNLRNNYIHTALLSSHLNDIQ